MVQIIELDLVDLIFNRFENDDLGFAKSPLSVLVILDQSDPDEVVALVAEVELDALVDFDDVVLVVLGREVESVEEFLEENVHEKAGGNGLGVGDLEGDEVDFEGTGVFFRHV